MKHVGCIVAPFNATGAARRLACCVALLAKVTAVTFAADPQGSRSTVVNEPPRPCQLLPPAPAAHFSWPGFCAQARPVGLVGAAAESGDSTVGGAASGGSAQTSDAAVVRRRLAKKNVEYAGGALIVGGFTLVLWPRRVRPIRQEGFIYFGDSKVGYPKIKLSIFEEPTARQWAGFAIAGAGIAIGAVGAAKGCHPGGRKYFGAATAWRRDIKMNPKLNYRIAVVASPPVTSVRVSVGQDTGTGTTVLKQATGRQPYLEFRPQKKDKYFVLIDGAEISADGKRGLVELCVYRASLRAAPFMTSRGFCSK